MNPAYQTKHNLAADICDRIKGMQSDSSTNNAQVVTALLGPVYQALHEAQIKITLLKAQRDNLIRMEENQRMLANQLREELNAIKSK